jgi:hypothetical protein
MLWDQLARAIKERSAGANRLLLLVGSGEAEERKLDVAGHTVVRESGGLTHADEGLEISMRHSIRKVAGRLTDEGVYAVGMLGVDRGLVGFSERTVQLSERFEKKLWTAPGVIPVLGCLAGGKEESYLDIHPVVCAACIATSLGDSSRVIVLSRRRTPSISPSQDAKIVVTPSKLREESAFHAGFPWPAENTSWQAVYAGDLATFSGVEVR